MIRTTAALVLLAATGAFAENWPEWRGPRANGVSEEANLPSRWDETSGIAWRTPLEGLGTSTPVVWEDSVFVTSQLGMGPIDGRGAEFPEAVAARDYRRGAPGVTFLVQAFHRKDGRLLWEHRFESRTPSSGLPPVHPKHNLASPSVVTDGRMVYAWMGTGALVALSLEGKLVWDRDLGRELAPFDVLWGHGSSPALYRDRLFLLCDHPPGAYLLALDKATGKEIWKVSRGEGIRSYSTPFLASGPSGEELIVNSSHRIESYDPEDGSLLWYAGEPVTLAIGMPVDAGGVLFASRGYSSGPYSAMRLGGRGDVSGSHVKWHVPTRAPYISSLLYYQGLVYMATELGIVTVVDAENGETLWRERLGGSFAASPVAGDGKIYFLNESGETVVLKAGRAPAILARNAIGERTLASPAISNGAIFLRSDASVMAISGTRD
jgi:outer membrane protein assembly factor BamB